MSTTNKPSCFRDDWALKAEQYPLPLSPSTPLYVELATHIPEACWYWNVQVHEGFEIGIVLEGSLSLEYKDTAKMLRKGDVWLCSAWEPHEDHLTTLNPTLLVVAFFPQFLGDERFAGFSWEDIFAAPAKDRPWVSTPEMRKSVLALAQGLRKEIEQKPPAWEISVRLGVLNLLFLMSRGWQPPAQHNQPSADADDMRRIIPALTLVREDPSRHIPVSEVAKACALNETSFRALFRKYMGMNFADYRLQYRLSYVARQLMLTTEPMEAIATQVGFYDASHLNNAFVKQYGCTPGKYRVLHGNKNGESE